MKKIDGDYARFKDIIKGKIKQNLKKFITKGSMISHTENESISIPLPRIQIPKFTYSQKQMGGVGAGPGKPGKEVAQGEATQTGQGQAGNMPQDHSLEVDVTIEELAHMLGEELELPKIKPKGSGFVMARHNKYSSIHMQGPESLKHFKRTFREALKREIAAGTYDPKNPVVLPVKRDKRFKSWKITEKPEHNAVILYQMDVSGSMGDEQKEIVRMEAFWIDTWLKSQYNALERRYIIHDAAAKEVNEEAFYKTRESGGTLISSAYKLCQQIIEAEYCSQNWNVYVFHFSDGDNWSGEDTKHCLEILKNQILPRVNLFCYGQVESRYGSGQFIKDLEENLQNRDSLVTSRIESKEAVYASIKEFLGKGR